MTPPDSGELRHECQCGRRILGRGEERRDQDGSHTWSECKPDSGEREVCETGRAAMTDSGDALLGSSLLPAMISVGTRMVQLGDVVRRAFSASGLSEAQWNTQPTLERESRLARTVFDMRGVPVDSIAVLLLSLAQRILAALEKRDPTLAAELRARVEGKA